MATIAYSDECRIGREKLKSKQKPSRCHVG